MPLGHVTVGGVRTEPNLLNFGAPLALAAAGTSVADGGAITGRFTIVSGADNTKGVVLPSTAKIGDAFLVYSSVAANGLKVYAPSGSLINDGSANAAVAVEGRTLHMFVQAGATSWVWMGLANA